MSDENVKSTVGEIAEWYWESSGDKDRVRAALTGARIIYAVYTSEDYEGDSVLIYEKAGKLYLDTSSHCSCHGLEFSPGEPYFDRAAVLEALSSRDRSKVEAAWPEVSA